jgi:diacylglycerol kinase family enzyme
LSIHVVVNPASAGEAILRMEADGELIGCLPARIRVLPGVLKLLC